MLKHLYPALLLLFFQNILAAQEPCGTDILHQQSLNNPTYAAKHAAYEQKMLEKAPPGTPEAAKMVVTLPVVVHIIHNGGSENISDTQVSLGIQQLNEAFANTGYYDQNTGTDVMVQFCLALRTSDNQPTTGINRVQNALTDLVMETEDVPMKNLSRWDPTQYVNIWIVNEICSAASGCGVAGYAYFPSSHGNNNDGIVMESEFLGSSPGNTGVLIHEMGHYLGLYHTFQGGCTNDDCLTDGDRVCDTPPDQSTLWTPCTATPNTCNTDALSGFATDQNDMISNFMDYTDFNCFHDFTPGQSVRMNAAILNERQSLLLSPGCLNPCPNPVDAAFNMSNTLINLGDNATFANTSTNAASYVWKVNELFFSNAANPSYTFNTEGFYQIELIALSGQPDLCLPDSMTISVEVRCPVVADFAPSTFNAEPGETVTFTNNSLNYNTLEWFVNGVSQGPLLTSYTFVDPGVYTVQLMAGNGICAKSRLHYISVYDTCSVPVFQKTFGNNRDNTATKAVYLDDGNLLIAGTTILANGPTDVVFLKLTPNGVPIWTKRWGNVATNENINALRALPGGQFAATLTTTAFTSVDPVFVKFNADGTPQWQRTVHTGFDDQFNGFNATSDGGFIISGAVRPTGGWEAFFLKLDANGNQEWAKMYNGGNTDFPNEVRELPGGGYISSGFTLSYGQNTSSIHDGLLIRLDDLGNVLWTKAYGQTGNEGFGRVFLTSDGGFITFGGSGSFNGTNDDVYFNDIWAVKTDASGNLLWSKVYRTNLNINCTSRGAIQGNDGGYVLSGNDFGALGNFETFYLKINDAGDIEWSRIYGASGIDRVVDVAAAPNGYLLPGTSNSVGAGGSDMYIVKTDNAGYAGECLELQHLVAATPVAPVVENGSLTSLSTPVLQTANIPVTNETSFTEAALCATNCITEVCYNGLDDDGDGLFDCLDPDCDCFTCEPSNADIWYFGDKSGLDFREDPPVVLTNGQTYAREGTAVVSDVFGQLLFYTDGQRLFDRNHAVMPNGSFLFGNESTSQDLIVPHPGNKAQYYVFTPNCMECLSPFGLSYSLVDMSLNGGLGDVVAAEKNIALTPSSDRNEHLTAVKHCNGEDYWVMGHSGVTNAYYGWLIDANGLNMTPVVTNTGMSPQVPPWYGDNLGQMKFSPDGTRLARTLNANNGVELCDFNPLTGAVSNPQLLQSPGATGFYGLEFSPDGRLLYATTTLPHVQLLQFNLNTGEVTVLLDIFDAFRIGQLQLAPNGKIYMSNTSPTLFNPLLSVIHKPNIAGLGCLFVHEGFNLVGVAGACNGLPNFVCDVFWKPFVAFKPYDTNDTLCNLPQSKTFYLEKLSCAVDSLVWQVTGNATVLSQNRDSIVVSFSNPGPVEITVRALAACGEASDTLKINITDPPVPALELGPDIAVCDNGVVTLNAGSGWASYLWSNLTTDSLITTTGPGLWIVETRDACGNTDTDSVLISILPATELNLADSFFVCQNETMTFTLPAPFTAWQWFPETMVDCVDCPTVNITGITDTASYIALAQTAAGCYSADTVWLAPGNGTIQINIDTSLCQGSTLSIWGATISTDTTLQININSAVGCDSFLNIQAVVWPVHNDVLGLTACPNETFTFNGQTLQPDTFYLFIFSTLHGCDSALTVQTSVLDSSLNHLNLTVCPGETASFNGQILAPDSTYTFVFTNFQGCDSTWMVQVSVYDLPAFDLGADQSICQSSAPSFSLPAGFSGWTWQPAGGVDCATCPVVQLQSTVGTNTYEVTALTAEGCAVSDTLGLMVFPDTVYLNLDTSFCAGSVLIIFGLDITADTLMMLFFDGPASCDTLLTLNAVTIAPVEETQVLEACAGDSVQVQGVYLPAGAAQTFVYTAASGCDSLVHVEIIKLDTALTTINLANCDGQSVLWNGQELLPENTYLFPFSGQNGCDSTVAVKVSALPGPVVALPSDTLLQLGQSIDLTPLVSGAAPFNYAWQPPGLLSCSACPDPVALPLADTWFSITVTDAAGCVASDSMLVLINPDCGLYVPNVFRPDDDGINDNFYPYAGDCVREVLYLRVYDRWGELVFERKNFPPNTENMGWNGKFRGDPALPGVYVWVAEFEYLDGTKNVQKGDVTLIN